MRWFVLVVAVVIGVLFLYDKGIVVQQGQPAVATPIAPTSTPWFGDSPRPTLNLDGSTRAIGNSQSGFGDSPRPTLNPTTLSLLSTPEPLWKLFEGVWMRVYGFDRAEFSEQYVEIKASGDSIVSTHTVNYTLEDSNHIWISRGIGLPGLTYLYEFKNDYNILILTNTDTGDRFIYVRQSSYVERQPEAAAPPQPLILPIKIKLPTPTPTPTSTPTVTATLALTPTPDSSSASVICNVKTIESSQPASLTFVNESDQPVRLNWLDFNGNEKFYHQLEPGQRYFIATYLTHPWCLREANSGAPFFVMPVTEKAQVVTIYSTSTVELTPGVLPRETTIGTPTMASIVLEYYGANYTPEELRELFIQTAKDRNIQEYLENETFYENGGILNKDLMEGLALLGYNWTEDCRETKDEDFAQRRQQLQESLSRGRPVLIGLYDSSGGHEVVLVGYNPTFSEYTYLDPEQISVNEEQLKSLWQQDVINRGQSIKSTLRCIIFTSPKPFRLN